LVPVLTTEMPGFWTIVQASSLTLPALLELASATLQN